VNVDPYLTLHQIQSALSRVTYRPGWTITAHPHPFEGAQLRIVARGVPDSTNPAASIDLGIDDWIPPLPDLDALWRFLAWRLGRIEQHEMREWLRVDSRPVFNPHPEAT
jgi:hypothetical protein